MIFSQLSSCINYRILAFYAPIPVKIHENSIIPLYQIQGFDPYWGILLYNLHIVQCCRMFGLSDKSFDSKLLEWQTKGTNFPNFLFVTETRYPLSFRNTNCFGFPLPAPILGSSVQPLRRALPVAKLSKGEGRMKIPAHIDPPVLGSIHCLLLRHHHHLNHVAGQKQTAHDACRSLLVAPTPVVAPDFVGKLGELPRNDLLLILQENI